jgi:glycosyltransferase involved in cell wall biosynthesis
VTRIARIITRLNIGGPAIQAINLTRELSTRDFDTLLLHGRISEGEGDMRDFLDVRSARTQHVPTLVRPVSPGHDIRAWWTLFRAFHRWKPAIVHTHMAKAGAVGRLAAIAYNLTARRQRARIVHTYHGHVFEGYFGQLSTAVFLRIERWLARRSDVLIAISVQLRDDLVRTHAIAPDAQVVVVPLGFDLRRFTAITDDQRKSARRTLGIPEGACVVTTVGRLTQIKAQSHFLHAARQFKGQDRYVFLVVGNGELRQTLENEAKQLGVERSVRFLGWRGDLETVYGATDVFVLTSRNEGTPVALIEAMAAGVACVSSGVGGVRDVITSEAVGTVVPFGDIDALARSIALLAGDPAARNQMGSHARQEVRQRFDQARLVDDIAALYRRILNDGGTVSPPVGS